jgi:hypothetical protein
MKYLFFTSILLMSLYSAAETRYAVAMGPANQEVLWLRQKSIHKKEVYVIGYQSAQKRQLERAMPRKDFLMLVKELQGFQKEIRKQQAFASPFCREQISIENNNKVESLCMESVARTEKQRLIRWVKKQSNIVVGIY